MAIIAIKPRTITITCTLKLKKQRRDNVVPSHKQ